MNFGLDTWTDENCLSFNSSDCYYYDNSSYNMCCPECYVDINNNNCANVDNVIPKENTTNTAKPVYELPFLYSMLHFVANQQQQQSNEQNMYGYPTYNGAGAPQQFIMGNAVTTINESPSTVAHDTAQRATNGNMCNNNNNNDNSNANFAKNYALPPIMGDKVNINKVRINIREDKEDVYKDDGDEDNDNDEDYKEEDDDDDEYDDEFLPKDAKRVKCESIESKRWGTSSNYCNKKNICMCNIVCKSEEHRKTTGKKRTQTISQIFERRRKTLWKMSESIDMITGAKCEIVLVTKEGQIYEHVPKGFKTIIDNQVIKNLIQKVSENNDKNKNN